MPLQAFREFLRWEAAGGVILLAAAVLALILSNSPLSPLYDAFFGAPVTVSAGAFGISKPLLLWVNDGLMAVFFLLVGLEIKRELLEGELSTVKTATLPAIAAIGGMIVPAVIYIAINWGNPVAMNGWAIPAATDIAFALGVLSLLGKRVPISLKIFLTAVAILDDLGAIIIIALFYTADLSTFSLLAAGLAFVVLMALNRVGVTAVSPYVFVGIVLWVCVLKSGVHATLAGVMLAFFIPLRANDREGHSPLVHMEHKLQPWVAFFIMPLFALANAGVSLAGISLEDLLSPVPLGIAAGLFIGKQLGIFASSAAAIRFGWAHMPEGTNWLQLYAVGMIAGIGFTMSLFIGTLAFTGPEFAADVRIGVLSGSLLSAVLGYMLLRLSSGLPAAAARRP